MIHHVDFDAKQYEADRAEVFHQAKDLELYSNTQVSKPNTDREKLYQKVQDIHNYKAEYELKCEAEAALETDLYRLGQIDGSKFIKGDRALWHEWSYKKGYGVGIEEYHDLAYAS